MLWVLIRTISLRQFFGAPKTYVRIDGQENNDNFTLKIFNQGHLCLYVWLVELRIM